MKLYIVFPTFSFYNEIVHRKRDGYVSKFISVSLVTMMDQRLICISKKVVMKFSMLFFHHLFKQGNVLQTKTLNKFSSVG